jgi:hypothetical protein
MLKIEEILEMEENLTPQQKAMLLDIRCTAYLIGMKDAEKGVFNRPLYDNTATYHLGWGDFVITK